MLKKLALGALSVLVLTGCSKITAENYSKISVGMSFTDVKEVIGEPENCDAMVGIMSCKWGDKKASIKIKFAQEKVIYTSAEGL